MSCDYLVRKNSILMMHCFLQLWRKKYKGNAGLMQPTVPPLQQKWEGSLGKADPGIMLLDFGFGLLLTVPHM